MSSKKKGSYIFESSTGTYVSCGVRRGFFITLDNPCIYRRAEIEFFRFRTLVVPSRQGPESVKVNAFILIFLYFRE